MSESFTRRELAELARVFPPGPSAASLFRQAGVPREILRRGDGSRVAVGHHPAADVGVLAEVLAAVDLARTRGLRLTGLVLSACGSAGMARVLPDAGSPGAAARIAARLLANASGACRGAQDGSGGRGH